ncbi:hypothetical protein O3P69_020922, partial [Scylla paramamosain]
QDPLPTRGRTPPRGRSPVRARSPYKNRSPPPRARSPPKAKSPGRGRSPHRAASPMHGCSPPWGASPPGGRGRVSPKLRSPRRTHDFRSRSWSPPAPQEGRRRQPRGAAQQVGRQAGHDPAPVRPRGARECRSPLPRRYRSPTSPSQPQPPAPLPSRSPARPLPPRPTPPERPPMVAASLLHRQMATQGVAAATLPRAPHPQTTTSTTAPVGQYRSCISPPFSLQPPWSPRWGAPAPMGWRSPRYQHQHHHHYTPPPHDRWSPQRSPRCATLLPGAPLTTPRPPCLPGGGCSPPEPLPTPLPAPVPGAEVPLPLPFPTGPKAEQGRRGTGGAAQGTVPPLKTDADSTISDSELPSAAPPAPPKAAAAATATAGVQLAPTSTTTAGCSREVELVSEEGEGPSSDAEDEVLFRPDPNVVEARCDNGLVRGHAYSITRIKYCDIQTPRVSGKILCDKSQEWQFIPPEEKEEMGLTFKHDGEFWMSFKDFLTNFTMLEMTNLNPDSLEDEDIIGSVQHKNFLDTFWHNPQYRITLTEVDDDDDNKCTVIVALMQKNRCSQRKLGLECLTIGFAIYYLRDPDGVPRPLDLNSSSILPQWLEKRTSQPAHHTQVNNHSVVTAEKHNQHDPFSPKTQRVLNATLLISRY